jgi:hypothetical protein
MLFTGLCHAFFWVTTKLVSVFPVADTTWLSGSLAHIADGLGVLHRLDAYFPVVTWLSVVGIYTSVWGVIGVVVGVRKLWSLFTGGGGI